MPRAEFFAKLGLFVARDFLPEADRDRLRAEARRGAMRAATVRRPGNTNVVDEAVRVTLRVSLPAEVVAVLDGRMRSIMPELERHFGVTLTLLERPQYLIYREGGYYRLHRDRGVEEDADTKDRKVSAVLFLNGESDVPASDGFGGGAIKFYGLIDDPEWRTYGFPLNGDAGLFVAFRSETAHEVSPVTRGERHTVVTWYS